jgi:hypothetical protein
VHHLIALVSNAEELQPYAVRRLYAALLEALASPSKGEPALLYAAAWAVGEYGEMLPAGGCSGLGGVGAACGAFWSLAGASKASTQRAFLYMTSLAHTSMDVNTVTSSCMCACVPCPTCTHVHPLPTPPSPSSTQVVVVRCCLMSRPCQ